MEPERIELSQRERDRLKVLHEIEQGLLSQVEAARPSPESLPLVIGCPTASSFICPRHGSGELDDTWPKNFNECAPRIRVRPLPLARSHCGQIGVNAPGEVSNKALCLRFTRERRSLIAPSCR